MNLQAKWKFVPRPRHIIAAVLVLTLTYALTGFLLAPWIVKRELPRLVEEKLHCRARIGELTINPFKLSLRATNFSLEEMDGKPVIGFTDATIDLAWRSLLQRAWILRAVHLADLSVNVVISKQGILNLATLTPPTSNESQEQPSRFAIDHFLLENGKLAFADEREGYRNSFERISLELYSLTTLRQAASPYVLAARTPNGTKLRWKGELSLLPLVASGTLAVENILLPELDPYLRGYVASRIVTGRADLELPFHFAINNGKPQFTLQNAKLAVNELSIAARGEKTAFSKIGRFTIDGVDFNMQEQSAVVRALQLADVVMIAKRDAKGELDIARLTNVPVTGTVTAQPESEVWRARFENFQLSNAALAFTDETAKKPLVLNLRGLHAKLKLDVGSDEKGLHVHVDQGELGLTEGQVGTVSWKQPAVTFGDIALRDSHFDSDAAMLAIDRIRIGNLSIDAVMKDGSLSLVDLMPAGGESRSARPIVANVNFLEIADGGLKIADRTSGISLALAHLWVKLKDLSSDASKPLGFEFSGRLQSGGRIGARGRLASAGNSIEAKVEAQNIALAPLQPLLAQFANVKLASGEVSLAGLLTAGGKKPRAGYTGSASVTNIALDDHAGERLLGWKSLATNSLHFTIFPNTATIDELRWSAPVGKLVIAADHTTNVGRAFAQKNAAASAPGNENKADSDSGFAMEVRRVKVEQGELDFADESLRPGFAATIRDLAGEVNGLSSEKSTRSQFALEGRVGEFGYAHITGTLNPFALRERTNFRLQFRNLDLTTVSPYSMKFAGYRIASGRLSLDLNYRVHNSLLEGDDQITLDQFTLGERVESPDALKLPLELAIALLKDSDGRIDVAIPVSGNLDDPQFSYGTLVWKAIGNLITGVVSAPFRALAHLFGGKGEEAGIIAFDPGSSKVQVPEQEKLSHVVVLLAKRPELKLNIPGRYDSAADANALKHQLLNREINRRAGFTATEEEEPGPINIDDSRTRAALRELFAERFSQAELDKYKAEAEAKERRANAANGKEQTLSLKDRVRNFASGEPQVADPREFYRALARRLRDAQPLTNNALPELAQKRAQAIEEALKAAGADPTRISVSTAEPVSNADAKLVTVQLALTAS